MNSEKTNRVWMTTSQMSKMYFTRKMEKTVRRSRMLLTVYAVAIQKFSRTA